MTIESLLKSQAQPDDLRSLLRTQENIGFVFKFRMEADGLARLSLNYI